MTQNGIFTSEAVAPGHPDKVADQISDAVLDAHLRQDPAARVACETLCKEGLVVLAGEITSRGKVNYRRIVQAVLRRIGYTDPKSPFSDRNVRVQVELTEQSPEIARGVDASKAKGLGAGDQGMMYGYACRETPALMPAPIWYAHRIMRVAWDMRRSGQIPWLRPDGKCQVTMRYRGRQATSVAVIVFAQQHAPDVPRARMERQAWDFIVRQAIPAGLLRKSTEFRFNAAGTFVKGGPEADCGLTGRKIICDTYGGRARHGGGAFSGKDLTKVDRSGAYAARQAAKWIVASGRAEEAEVQLAYAIGHEDPVSVTVNTFGTGYKSNARIRADILRRYDFRPAAIIRRFRTAVPDFESTARDGHFGIADEKRPWEDVDRIGEGVHRG